MKKALSLVLACAMALSLVACGGSDSSSAAAGGSSAAAGGSGATAATATAGVCFYNFADTFIANARQSLENIAAADGAVKVTTADSQGAAETQDNNMNNFYTQGVDFMLLNNLKTNAKPELIEKAKSEGVTLMFINSDSPTDEEFAMYDKVYHVSSAAEQSGKIMGDAMLEYINTHDDWDRNGNGTFDYIMLLGTQGNYDTIQRSERSVEVLANAGIKLNCVGGEQLCEWSRATAQDKVAALLANYSEDIDGVFACNDDMALGAIEALKAGGFFTGDDTYLPVCGVDATQVGCDAIREGTLLVTSMNNPVLLGKATYKTMKLLAAGEELTQENLGLEGCTVDGHHVWLNYTAVNAENVDTVGYDINDVDISK